MNGEQGKRCPDSNGVEPESLGLWIQRGSEIRFDGEGAFLCTTGKVLITLLRQANARTASTSDWNNREGEGVTMDSALFRSG
jgi:hypothetical protein